MASPSTRDVSKVTLQAFLLPAGSDRPSRSNLSLNCLPPFFDFALNCFPIIDNFQIIIENYLRRTPPRSEAFRHSGGDRRLWTSPTVTLKSNSIDTSSRYWFIIPRHTLYLEVEDSRDNLPGTEQKTSVGDTFNIPGSLEHQSLDLRPPHTSSFLMEKPTSGGMNPWLTAVCCCSSWWWKPRGCSWLSWPWRPYTSLRTGS